MRCGPTRSSIHETPHQKIFRITSLNVGTLRGRSSEVVETVSRRCVDLCFLHEVRQCGAPAHMIVGKDSRYMIFWIGSDNGNGSVGILLAEEWIEQVYRISRISNRLKMIKLDDLSCYALQVRLDNTVKNVFYDLLNAAETRVICGDFSGHVGKLANGYEDIHGGHGYDIKTLKENAYSNLLLLTILLLGTPMSTKKIII